MLRRIGRPSPALVIACISLFVALGGVGYAAATGSIDGREIKNNSVASKDIRNNSVAGGDVRTSTLRGSDVRANTLTGSDISESSLGKVPSAGQADNAATAGSATTASTAGSVGGLVLRKINYRADPVSASQPILDVGGLVLNAACAAGNTLSVTARTTSQNSSIYATASSLDNSTDGDGDRADDLEGGGFDTATTFDALVGGDANPNLVTLVYHSEAGTQVTANFVADRASSGAGCVVHGSAIAG